MKKSLVIVQPYIPKYRVHFFEGLIEELRSNGIDCRVAAPGLAGQHSRNDSADVPWRIEVPNRRVRAAGHTLSLGGASRSWRNADAVIVGHLGSSIDTYQAILEGKLGRRKVGLWGHIKSYVSGGNTVDAWLERWQLKNVQHVFAYSPSGRDYATAVGVRPENVTTVMNSVDTKRLEALMSAALDEVDARFMQEHDLVEHKVLAFIGGLDKSKRIDLIAEALDVLWSYDSDIKLLVGGTGDQEYLLRRGVQRGQVVLLGYADTDTKAQMGRVSSALLMPGRIGLVAVESLAMKLPILTTEWPYHAPEFEYLTKGISYFESANDSQSYAALIRGTLVNAKGHRETAVGDWEFPRLETMIDNFVRGVRYML